MHAAEAHANGYNNQTDHKRSHIGAGRRVELIGDGKYEQQKQGCANYLIEKSCLRHGRECWEGSKNSSGFFQVRIDLLKRRKIVLVHNGGSSKCPSNLCGAVGKPFFPGKAPKERN